MAGRPFLLKKKGLPAPIQRKLILDFSWMRQINAFPGEAQNKECLESLSNLCDGKS